MKQGGKRNKEKREDEEKKRKRDKKNTTKEKRTNQDINAAHNQQLQHKATTTTTKNTYIPNGLHKRKSTGTIPVGTNETFFGCFQMQLHTNTPKRQRLMAVFV